MDASTILRSLCARAFSVSLWIHTEMIGVLPLFLQARCTDRETTIRQVSKIQSICGVRCTPEENRPCHISPGKASFLLKVIFSGPGLGSQKSYVQQIQGTPSTGTLNGVRNIATKCIHVNHPTLKWDNYKYHESWNWLIVAHQLGIMTWANCLLYYILYYVMNMSLK